MSKESAIALVNQFVASGIGRSWPNIDRAALAAGLIERINDPNRINQGGTPLCGPASLIRSVAIGNSDAYARAAIDLYTSGRARINNLDIRPGDAVLNAPVPSGTSPADWMMLASLRDSDNWLLSTAGFFANGAAGVTIPPTIETWFRNAGFTQIVNRTSLTGGDIPLVKSLHVQEASRLFTQGYNVAMLIDADLLETGTQNDIFSMYPDHWVVLASRIAAGGSTNYAANMEPFRVFTWGRLMSVPVNPATPLIYERFLTKFYGFVAARL